MCNPPKRRYSRVFLVREIVGTFLTGVRCRKKPQKRRKKETSAPWRQKKRKKKKICNENKEEKRIIPRRRRRRRRLRRSTPTPTTRWCDRERTRTCLKKRGRLWNFFFSCLFFLNARLRVRVRTDGKKRLFSYFARVFFCFVISEPLLCNNKQQDDRRGGRFGRRV